MDKTKSHDFNQKIEELLTRGVEAVYPTKEALKKVLRSGKKLTIYQGFDPTGDKLHVGHMVGLMKLRQWQALGHNAIFLIGDGTGQAGDPSGKTKARDVFHTNEELRQNAKDYVMQAKRIVHFDGDNPIKILYNGDWLNKLGLVELLDIAGNFSLQQLAERDLFQERIKRGESVNLREFLYPLLQGYDSVAMKVDVELGGSDQMFNMLAGRTLVKHYLHKEKFVVTTPLLADATGRKIGKTEGNAIAITDKPEELFEKIMAFPDEVIVDAFYCLTDVPQHEIQAIERDLKDKGHPIAHKKHLAFEITKLLNSEEDARRAQEIFENVIQKGELPTDIPEISFETDEEKNLEEFLVSYNLCSSKSEAKRLIEQGGVSINEKRHTDPKMIFAPKPGTILRVGKKQIVRIVTK